MKFLDIQDKEKLILSNIPGAISMFRLKKDGRLEIDYISKGLATLNGYEYDEYVQMTTTSPMSVFVEEDIEPYIAEIKRCVDAEQTVDTFFRAYRKDKSIIAMHIVANVVTDIELEEDDRAVLCGMLEKQSEEQLRIFTEQRRFRRIFEVMGIAYWEWSRAHGYYHSEKYEKYAINEMQEEQIWNPDAYLDYVHPDDREAMKQFMNQNFDEEIRKSAVIRCKLKDGTYRLTELFSVADLDENGNLMRLVSMMRDVDQVWATQKMELEVALIQAQAASIAKGNFLSNMSHEIRTPLNAIIGYLLLAQGKDASEKVLRKSIDNCSIASNKLLQIINDILDISAIESGKLKIAKEEYDIKKELTDLTTIFYQNAKEKGIDFQTHIKNLSHEWIIGDPLRVNQILMNLLSNAVKFTPKAGKIILDVTQSKDESEKIHLRFSVHDTGIGMSEEYMRRLFQPFEQEDTTTAKKYGGSGLGLSITHNLVEMMGGTIEVVSKQNEGTTFFVDIPFDKAVDHLSEQKEHVDFSKIRVLLVDDEEEERSYIKKLLKQCGVKSDSVANGEEAIRRIRSREGTDYHYDVCILDWGIPGLNGIEITKQIRTAFGDKLPVIIATAYDVTPLEEDAKKAGVNRVIAKPLFQSTMFDILVTILGGYQPEPANKQSEKIDMHGVHILLVEDNVMNMDIAATILHKAGIKVDQATNGKEAVEQFERSRPGTYDMILMDIQMPEMDGYEATKMIRNSNHAEAVSMPIIAMTANAFEEDVKSALNAGMNAHISKPVNYDKLFRLVKEFSKK